jgi:hypothetical protein
MNYSSDTSKNVAFVGIQDILVIQTDDTLLVLNKNSAQDVKTAADIAETQMQTQTEVQINTQVDTA